MIYNVARVRRLFTKFQVDTWKIKKTYICACTVAHLAVEVQDMIYNVARVGGYLQNFKSIHAKVKKIDLRMRSCAPCS